MNAPRWAGIAVLLSCGLLAAAEAAPPAAPAPTAATRPARVLTGSLANPVHQDPVAESSRPLHPEISQAISDAVAEDLAQLGIPGLSLAVGEGGELRFSAGLGLADVENEVPARPETVYRLASVSKPMTAAAVLRLAEGGRLDVDAPIWKYCTGFPAKPQPVTARQILCHQSGVRHYRPGEQQQVRHFDALSEGLVLFKDDPLQFEPGTNVLYSTHAFTLLGCALEGATGRTFPEVLREEVFAPAGMTSTQPDDVRALVRHRAGGYVRSEGGELMNCAFADMSYKVPGGGLSGTASDVARFGLALLAGRIVSRPTLQQMLTPQRTRAGRVTGFGLGLTVTRYSGKREAWHMGGQEGVSTVVYMRPDQNVAIALLCNLEGVGTPLVSLARRIADLLTAERVYR